MLAVASIDPRAIPYFAVCFFAGVRPEACTKLKWSDVGTNGYLYVPHSVNKTGHAYSVEILPVLASWLEGWETCGNKREGDLLPLSASTLKRLRKRAMAVAGIADWLQDGPRKTFATAHRGAFKCKTTTCAALGHKGTTVLDEFYDSRLMTEAEAQEYWKILPPESDAVAGEETEAL
jgi:integrase